MNPSSRWSNDTNHVNSHNSSYSPPRASSPIGLEPLNHWLIESQRVIVIAGAIIALEGSKTRRLKRKPRRKVILSNRNMALEKVEYWEHCGPLACYDTIGMTLGCFTRLWRELQGLGLLRSTPHVPCKVQVAVTLWMLQHNQKHYGIREIFQVSSRTVSKAIHDVLDAVFHPSFYYGYVKQPKPNIPGCYNRTGYQYESPCYAPIIRKCLGTIDGTHIKVNPPAIDAHRFRSRKGVLSTNVLAACDFKMRFTYLLAGWEGSQNDAAVYQLALANSFEIQEGYVYLADAGYPLNDQLLTPFWGERYHLKEWGRASLRPANAKELFDRRHSSLQNVIEQILGVLKKRFPVLSDGTNYPLKTQVQIIYVCCCIHNFIRAYGNNPLFEAEGIDDDTNAIDEMQGETLDANDFPFGKDDDIISRYPSNNNSQAKATQSEMASEIWERYREDVRSRGI